MRKIKLETGEIYHIYNRGNNKRPIFLNIFDLKRFYQSMDEFNVESPIGSIYENYFRKKNLSTSLESGNLFGSSASKLVDFVAFCLNRNHFHFLLIQLVDKGIEKFMHRIGTGFTKYFNQRHRFVGSLFQGPFKAKHVDSNEYLLHLSAYINLNHMVHQQKLGSLASKLWKSSWEEYVSKTTGKENVFCNKEIILTQFENTIGYEMFAKNSLHNIKEQKILEDLLKEELLCLEA